MNVIITGSNGLLGSCLASHVNKSGFNVVLTSLKKNQNLYKNKYFQGDLLDTTFVKNLIQKTKPDIIINTVALVNIDECENNLAKSRSINVDTLKNILKYIDKNTHLIQISTDQLFNGEKSFYNEEAMPCPLNNYGITKLEAEQESLKSHKKSTIIRTNIIGWSPPHHADTFVEWVYNSLINGTKINMFNDYYSCPIEINLFSSAILKVIKNKMLGIFNICGSERISKYEFGIRFAKKFSLDLDLINETSMDCHSFSVPRPSDLSLSVVKYQNSTGYDLPDVDKSLDALFENKLE